MGGHSEIMDYRTQKKIETKLYHQLCKNCNKKKCGVRCKKYKKEYKFLCGLTHQKHTQQHR